jgi:glucose/arabinose dehydrogenase/mono/diheme cytochrome c family protein
MRFPHVSTFSSAVALLASSVAHAADQPASPIGNADRGKTLFVQSCAVCHSTGTNIGPAAGQPGTAAVAGQGPLLAGVVGRRAASLPNFGYTPALTASRLTWDPATLDRFLTNPVTVVPGTNMVLPVPDATDRRDIIAFLATLKPVALPTAAETAAAAKHDRTAGDWENDAPGTKHRVNVAALPKPYATRSAGNNPKTVDRPADAKLSVPAGFEVKQFVAGLSGPRLIRTAPNGDLFVAETRQGRIRVLRTRDGADAPTENSVFAENLKGPFGIAFFPQDNPQWIYVGNLNSVVRFPYHAGDLKASGPAEVIVPELAGTTGGHSTRDLAFSLDGKRLFISVGSGSNVAEGLPKKSPQEIREWETAHGHGAAWGNETNRADVLVADPDGHGVRTFATGIRNAVGIAVQPGKGDLWVSVNERDGLGDDLVPDYISHIKEGGYYGWPWYYMGNHEDPRHAGVRPDLAGQAIVPDVPVQAHSAALEITFYPANVSGPAAFPAEYRGEIFGAFHGSWNRTGRTGSKVIRVRMKDGVATGEYEDFLTGFVVDDQHLWGRPVGVTVAHDGALIVTEDTKGTVWRIAYKGGAH